MSRWQERLLGLLGEAEEHLDRARGKRRPFTGPFRIIPYRGYGTEETAHLSGRVLEGEEYARALPADTRWKNFRRTLRRMESDEVPDATVRARSDGAEHRATTDEEGYFSLRLSPPGPPGALWRPVELELERPGPDRTTTWVQVPPPSAEYGVISDIDDTVIRTDVTRFVRMLRMVLLTNAHTRLPFEGVSAFYRALQRGMSGGPNPMFYVSSSPWNFYDLLEHIFEVHDVPQGTLFLKDYGLSRDQLLSQGHREHKLEAIRTLLDTYSHLPFVLLGDSGQHDPEIYREAVEEAPERVRAVYIRHVASERRGAEVREIAAALEARGVPMLLVDDTVTAARHAAGIGLISPDALPEVRAAREADEAAPGPWESLLPRDG